MDVAIALEISASLNRIHAETSRIREIIAQVPKPAPVVAVPWVIPVQLDDPRNIPRALRGGINEFLPDGSMRVTYPVNEAEGGIMVRVDYPERVMAECDLLFERPFDFPQGLKIFRIQSFDEGQGVNNWDVILVARGAESQGGINPMLSLEAARNAGAWWGSAQFAFREDVWYRLGIELRKGQAARPKSGMLRVTVDGKPVLDLASVEVISGSGHFADGRINRLHYGGWYSNGAKANPFPNPVSPARFRIRNACHIGA